MPEEEGAKKEEEPAEDADDVVQGQVTGIIYPPIDIRTIVDKTAQFVARNGREFESRIVGHESNNAKFSFLVPSDPYHAYYEFKIGEFKSGKSEEQKKEEKEAEEKEQKKKEEEEAAEKKAAEEKATVSKSATESITARAARSFAEKKKVCVSTIVSLLSDLSDFTGTACARGVYFDTP
jgi:splicing factor 3A subunit 1